MTNTSRRLRALSSALCQFEEADLLTKVLLGNAQASRPWPTHMLMDLADWTGHLAPWRKAIEEELESIYAEHQSARS